MKLQDWRTAREGGEAHTTPSGLDVKLRRVDILDLAAQGNIPAPLVSLVSQLYSGGDASPFLDLAAFPEYMQAIDLVATACLVWPPVAEVADEEHLAITELPTGDRLAIFNWANEVTTSLKPFRAQPDADGNPGQSGPGLREISQ